MHITQQDIAKKLNVTRITVSKALRNHPDISEKMRKKVLDTAESLGYTPNLIAQNLISKKTNTLGVVIPDLENSFFALATDSIIEYANQNNYSVIVTVSRENHNNEKLNIQKLIGMRVDGILICVSQQTDNSKIFKQLKSQKIPLVFFDRQFEGLNCSSIIFNDKNAAFNAVTSIIKAGYKKIANIGGYNNVSIGKERNEGFKQALKSMNIKLNNDWMFEGGYKVIDGYNAFMKLFESKNLPEVIFTVNDRVALGVYHAAKEKGVKIPEDIGIAAFGFNETAQTFTPPLSVINQNPREIGFAAAEQLLKEISNKNSTKPKQIILNEEFVWNDSILKNKK